MMPYPAPVLDAVTTGGFLLVLAIVVPVAGVLLAFVAGGRQVERIALGTMPLGLAIAVAIIVAMRQTGAPLVYLLGGWAPPLGVALRADGPSAVMMVITAVVICAVGVFAHADFRTPAGLVEARAPFAFWILPLAIWGGIILLLSLIWLANGAAKARKLKDSQGEFSRDYFTPVDLVGLYWHLVDLIWIFLFPLLYLIH